VMGSAADVPTAAFCAAPAWGISEDPVSRRQGRCPGVARGGGAGRKAAEAPPSGGLLAGVEARGGECAARRLSSGDDAQLTGLGRSKFGVAVLDNWGWRRRAATAGMRPGWPWPRRQG